MPSDGPWIPPPVGLRASGAECRGIDLPASEIREGLRIDAPPLGAVQIAAQGFAPDVCAPPPRVAPRLPRHVVERLDRSRSAALRKIGVRAECRDSPANYDRRQSAIERIQAVIQRTGENRCRVDVLILR